MVSQNLNYVVLGLSEKSTVIVTGSPFDETCGFTLEAFSVLSLLCIFSVLTMLRRE